MESEDINCDSKQEQNDSGCIQDESTAENNGFGQVNLLDLSDDVLLYILKHCTPRDLKALGFCCVRLGSLVREKSLWRYVDARSESCSQARLKWMLQNALHEDTHFLLLNGFARDATGCLGLINITRTAADEKRKQEAERSDTQRMVSEICEDTNLIPITPHHLERLERLGRYPAQYCVSAHRRNWSRSSGIPSWPEDDDMGRKGSRGCIGPQFSLSQPILAKLCIICPNLNTLALEYCNIDCTSTNLSLFPTNLKKLSLRGTKCYNMIHDKSFLFKIQDYLPILESLDVSECDWMDPSTLLPLSKMEALEELKMRDCFKLSEFVAYASLTSRYGFRALKSLDLRGSPVGDSEVSALGWLPMLEKLWLSSKGSKRPKPHAHYVDDLKTPHNQLHEWEIAEPDYFRAKSYMEIEDDVNGMGDILQSSDLLDCSGVSNENKGSESHKSSLNNSEATKRGTTRKSEDGSGDCAEINGEPCCKRRKTNGDKLKNSSENICDGDRDEPTKIADSKDDKIQSNQSKDIKGDENVDDESENKCKDSAPNAMKAEKLPHENSHSVSEGIESNRPGANVVNQQRHGKNEMGNNSENKQSGSKDKSNERKPDNRSKNRNYSDCYGCLKIDQLIDVGSVRCGRQSEVIVIASSTPPKVFPSTSRGNSENRSRRFFRVRDASGNLINEDIERDVELEESVKSDEEGENKNQAASENSADPENGVNEGASTSKDEKPKKKGKHSTRSKNKNPVHLDGAPDQVPRHEAVHPVQYQIEPRHHVLYVGVGPQLNTYRFPRESSELIRHLNYRPFHVESSSLVTDFSIRRFGRADGEDVNIIHIGPNGPMVIGGSNGSRPDRSNLRFLSVTGYRNVTDRSLEHLASSAPNLTHLDFTDTGVTESGAENFRSLRPDCELVYSPFEDKDDK